VGVFAGAAPDEMLALARDLGLDAIQLHGHLSGDRPDVDGPVDPPERCRDLAGLPVIRAVRLDESRPPPARLDAARQWIAAAAAAGAAPRMVIVDASVPRGTAAGRLGGTGAVVDWAGLAAAGGLGLPLALAGGLGPANVAAAIRASGCRAVDTASGVELAPGRKDPEKVALFVAAARQALGLARV
jgi:phosphoribosylanthranilate isomerase